MAREVRQFSVLVPAGTAIAAFQTTALTMPSRVVRSVRLRVPPGPAGSLGFRLASGGVQVIPWETGTWLVYDGEATEWPLEGMIDTGAWQLQAYNVGRWDHTVYVTMLLDPLPVPGSALGAPQPLDLNG